MSRNEENVSFVCENCERHVQPLTNGSYRNHCPFCLYSKHVDIKPGDRDSGCRGLMAPRGLKSSKKGMQIVHQCLRCGFIGHNKVAEYTEQPDSFNRIIELT